MSTPEAFLRDVLRPAMDQALPIIGIPSSPAADRLLLAAAGQESNWTHRYQLLANRGKGPARGFWQFERIGVRGVMEGRATAGRARDLVESRGLAFDSAAVWQALEKDDTLAAGFARLLWWGDPHPLPTSEAAAWVGYLRLWRPGKPHPERWGLCWRRAGEAMANETGASYSHKQ